MSLEHVGPQEGDVPHEIPAPGLGEQVSEKGPNTDTPEISRIPSGMTVEEFIEKQEKKGPEHPPTLH